MGGRPVLMERYPHGAEGKSFFQKRVPDNAPDWLTTDDRQHAERHDVARARDRRPRARRVGGEPRLPRLPRVAGARRRSRSRRRAAHRPRPAARHRLRRRARVAAHRARRCSTSSASSAYPKTTGKHGIHVYVRLAAAVGSDPGARARPSRSRASSRAAIPTSSPTRGGRKSAGERIFIDFNQNAPHKTVFGAWCVRARPGAQVSTPFALGRARHDRSRRADDRDACPAASPSAATRGPTIDTDPQSLEPLLALHDRDIANGLTDAPWPPVYPKMPGEPPRVAPSRAKKPEAVHEGG